MAEYRTLVITSGGFDPIHAGHIEYLQKAKKLDKNVYHICIVNTDDFLIMKKGFAFMNLDQRISIISELKSVDEVVVSIDADITVCKTIEMIANKAKYFSKIIFAKGGDRFCQEIPEAEICKKYNIEIIDGLGEKIESSSRLAKCARSRTNDKI